MEGVYKKVDCARLELMLFGKMRGTNDDHSLVRMDYAERYGNVNRDTRASNAVSTLVATLTEPTAWKRSSKKGVLRLDSSTAACDHHHSITIENSNRRVEKEPGK